MDEVAIQTDDVLIDRLRQLEAEKEYILQERGDTRPWETEICYVRRELGLRRTRHQLHDAYLKELEREAAELLALENQYPVADLDNSQFIFFN